MKWRLLLIGAFVAFLAAFLWLTSLDPEDRITPGMTLKQVEAILGRPSDNNGTSETEKYEYWSFDDRHITVLFEAYKENPRTLGEVRVTGATTRRRVVEWIEMVSSGYIDFTPSKRRHNAEHWAGDSE